MGRRLTSSVDDGGGLALVNGLGGWPAAARVAGRASPAPAPANAYFFFAAAALVALPSMTVAHFWPSSEDSYLKV